MANALQAFNDSQIGVVLGTVMHTVGAIAFLGGLVGYIAWHRHLKAGYHQKSVLNTSAFLTYFAILINLVGGFMRTWETGHPHLTEFATSSWVRAITIKHVFLFAGYAAAIGLFEVVAPRLIKAYKAGTYATASQSLHRVGVLVVALGIFVAAFLGALSTVIPIAAAEAMDDDMDHGGHTNETSVADRYLNATGQLSGFVPSQTAETRSTFEVAPGTVSINATLLWNPTQFCLRLNLLAPNTTAVPTGGCTPTPGTGRREVTLDAPAAGTWTYVIDATNPVNVNWDLSLRMPQASRSETLLVDSVTVAPGAGYEINTEMPLNGTINWDWTSSATLHFNLHSHFNDTVQDYIDEDGTSGRAAFTNEREGGYSLYWTNDGAVPVTLDYRVWGEFTLDSIFP